MGTLTTHSQQFLDVYVMMVGAVAMLGLYFCLMHNVLKRKLGIWKKRSKTSGTDTRPGVHDLQRLYQSLDPGIQDLSYTAPQTQTVSSSSSNYSWLQMSQSHPISSPQGMQSLTKCSKAASKALGSSQSQLEQVQEKLTSLLVSLEHSAKLAKECSSSVPKHLTQNSGNGTSIHLENLQSLETTLSMYVTHLRQVLKKSRKR